MLLAKLKLLKLWIVSFYFLDSFMRTSIVNLFRHSFALRMPMVRVATNIPNEKVPEDFEVKLTELLAESMGKPMNRIAVELCSSARLIHGGTKDPVVVITIKSIGAVSPSDNERHTERVTKLCGEKLGLPVDKVILDFVNLSPNDVGFAGTTVAAANK